MKMKKYLPGHRCVVCCVACRHVGLLMRFLQTGMSVNKNKKRYLPDGGRGCVVFVHVGVIYLCGCVRTCWLADALPADMDECKQYIYILT